MKVRQAMRVRAALILVYI